MENIFFNTDIKSNFNDFGFENPKEFKGQILAKVYNFYIGYAVWGETLKSYRWNQFGVDLEDDYSFESNLKKMQKRGGVNENSITI